APRVGRHAGRLHRPASRARRRGGPAHGTRVGGPGDAGCPRRTRGVARRGAGARVARGDGIRLGEPGCDREPPAPQARRRLLQHPHRARPGLLLRAHAMMFRSLAARLSALQQGVATLAIVMCAAASVWLMGRVLYGEESAILTEAARRLALNLDLELKEEGTLQRAAEEVLAEESAVGLRVDVYDPS